MIHTPVRFTPMNRPSGISGISGISGFSGKPINMGFSGFNDIQDVLTKTLYDVGVYALYGFLVGAILEYVLPKLPKTQDSTPRDMLMIILEIMVQVIIIVFAFMYISSKGGARYGLLVYLLFMIGTQPTLFKKISLVYNNLFEKNEPVESSEEDEYQDDEYKSGEYREYQGGEYQEDEYQGGESSEYSYPNQNDFTSSMSTSLDNLPII